MILYLIGQLTTDGGTGYAIEYTGSAIRALDMEERMTVCNMSIEAGARCGMIAPDDVTFDYLRGREFAPAISTRPWPAGGNCPATPARSTIACEVFNAADVAPQVTWGTNPGQVAKVVDKIPNPAELADENERKSAASALTYMGLKPGTPIEDVALDRVFIGSCTNSRISDLRRRGGRGQGLSRSPAASMRWSCRAADR